MNLEILSDEAFRKTYVTVTEFAKLVGLSAQTLRNYDKQGIFKPDYVTPSGRRLYNLNQVSECKGLKRGRLVAEPSEPSEHQESPEQLENHETKYRMINLSVSVTPNKEEIQEIKKAISRKSVIYTLTEYIEELKGSERLKETLTNSKPIIYSDMTNQISNISNLNGIEALMRFLTTNSVSEILIYLKHDNKEEAKVLEVLSLISKAYSIPLFEI